VTLAEGEHFHVRARHMYLNNRRLLRRGRWEEGWVDLCYQSDRLTPAGEWDHIVKTAEGNGDAIAIMPPERLGPNDLFAGRFVPEHPLIGEKFVRIYRCSRTDCPPRRSGGFMPEIVDDGGSHGPMRYR
jgi:hypothetical protein